MLPFVSSQPTLNTKACQNEDEHADQSPQERRPRAHLVVSRTIHRAQDQPHNAACHECLDPADDAVDQRHGPDPGQSLPDSVALRAERGPGMSQSGGALKAGEASSLRAGNCGAQLHEHSPDGGADVDSAVEEQRPVEGEAPDVGCVVEEAGVAGRGSDGPVEGGPVGGQVVVRDFGCRDWHFWYR